jgi:hypothetical protein
MVTSPIDIESFTLPEIPKWTIPVTSNRSSICCVTAAAFVWSSQNQT